MKDLINEISGYIATETTQELKKILKRRRIYGHESFCM